MEEEARAQMFDIMSTIQNLRGELRTEEEMLNTVKDLKRHLAKQSSDMDKLEKSESMKEEAMATCLQTKLAEVKQRNVELEDVCKDLELKMAQQHNTRQATVDILQKVLNCRDSEYEISHEDFRSANTRVDSLEKQLQNELQRNTVLSKENVALQQAIASEKKSSQEWQTKYERAVPEFKLGQNLAREIQKSKDEEVKKLNEKLMKESGRLKSTEEGNEKLRVMLKSKNKEMGSKNEELQLREVEIGQLRRDIRRLKAEVEKEKEKAMKMSEKFDRKEKERSEIEDKLWRKSEELLSRDKEVKRLHRQLQSKDEDVVRLKSNIKRNESDEEGKGDEKGARTKPAEAASKLSDDEEEEDVEENVMSIENPNRTKGRSADEGAKLKLSKCHECRLWKHKSDGIFVCRDCSEARMNAGKE